MIRLAIAVSVSIAIANAASFADYVAQASLRSCPAQLVECPK